MMTHALALTSFGTTGARPSVPLRDARTSWKPTSARMVRTRAGVTLFDEAGRYVGVVDAASKDAAFGRGGPTVLLRR
jgi:hypothetical protein